MVTTLIILGIWLILYVGMFVGIDYLQDKAYKEKLELLDKQLEREEQRINYINENHDFKYAEYGCVIDMEEFRKMVQEQIKIDEADVNIPKQE